LLAFNESCFEASKLNIADDTQFCAQRNESILGAGITKDGFVEEVAWMGPHAGWGTWTAEGRVCRVYMEMMSILRYTGWRIRNV
jgi:hypothetical protein